MCVADKLLAPPAADSDGESDGSDRVPVPSFQNSFSQAIEKAMLQLDSEAASVPPPVVEPGLTSPPGAHACLFPVPATTQTTDDAGIFSC